MRRNLSELICADLADLAYMGSEVVASEESIRYLIQMYQSKGKLVDVNLVHLDALQSHLEKLDFTQPGHYQFVLEMANRSKVNQRDHDIVHYCALDLYISPGQVPLAFVADHYKRHKAANYTNFADINKALGVQFLVAGGGVYQADEVHCPVFTLKHLMLTATDKEMHPFLVKLAATGDLPCTLFEWEDLSPSYLLQTHSVSMLLNYVDLLNKREGVEKAGFLLAESKFATKLGNTLFKSVELANKIRNKAIQHSAAELAGEAVLELEKHHPLEEKDEKEEQVDFALERSLIDVCYQERYPLAHGLLSRALDVQIQHPFHVAVCPEKLVNLQSTLAHPLFEFLFSHAIVVEICLQTRSFSQVFHDPNLLLLMQKGIINPYDIFDFVTEKPKDIRVKTAFCNVVMDNLPALGILTQAPFMDRQNKELITSILFSKKTKSFFQNAVLVDLLTRGFITLDMIEKIVPHQINWKAMQQLPTDADKMKVLREQFVLDANPVEEVSNVSEEEEETEELDLFSLPDTGEFVFDESDPGDESSTLSINPSYLVQSLCQGVFTTEPAAACRFSAILDEAAVSHEQAMAQG